MARLPTEMMDASMLRWSLGAGLLLCAGCFDGRDALGLPCEEDFQCGNGQVCANGACAWPGGLTETETETETETGTETETETESETEAGTGTGTGTDGPTNPFVGCDLEEDVAGEPTVRDIIITNSGNATSVALGSFSVPGRQDIAVLTGNPPQVTVFRYDGSQFVPSGTEVEVEIESMDLAAGDLDGDGLDDVAVVDANQTGAAVTLLWGDQAAPLQERAEAVLDLGIAFTVAIGNVAGEGNQVVVSSGAQTVATFLFSVSGRVPELRSQIAGVSASPWDTVVAELDGQAPAEILVAGSNDEGLDGIDGSDEVQIFTGADHSLARLDRLTGIRSPFGVDAGDLDGDGIPELVVVGKNVDLQTPTPGESSNISDIGLCRRASLDTAYDCDVWPAGDADNPADNRRGFNNVRLADLNCDGDLDVVIATSGRADDDDDGGLFFSAGPLSPNFVLTPLAAPGAVGNRIVIAEVTGDGRPDVVVPLFGGSGTGASTVRVYSYEGAPE